MELSGIGIDKNGIDPMSGRDRIKLFIIILMLYTNIHFCNEIY